MTTTLTPAEPPTAARLADEVKAAGRDAGFELVGVAPAVTPPGYPSFLDWLDRGYAGEMGYLERRRDARAHPRHVLKSVRSVVMVAMNYKHADVDHGRPTPRVPGKVARYARGGVDYHDLLRDRLKLVADRLHELAPGCKSRVVVDTAPLLERDFARLAGLGWFGKNTLLINKKAGSFLLLGGLLTDAVIAADEPHGTDHCGTCTACLDACPTDAFEGPHVLDARKCISYWNIEVSRLPGDTADPSPELAAKFGDHFFGCDVCQDVCPWNRRSPFTTEPAFKPRADLDPIDCEAVLAMTEAEFADRFRGTPLDRPGFDGLKKSAALVNENRSAVASK